MPLACLSCTQDNNNPCYGVLFYFNIPSNSTITETDSVKVVTQATQSAAGEIEIAPFINENSVGELYYQFNIILNGETYNFVIYKNNAQWILAKNDNNNYTNWATSTGSINDTCVFSTSLNWTLLSGDTILPNFNIDRVEKAVLSAPTNNEDDCTPPINVPISVSGKSIPTRIDTLYKCLDVKGTEYLNKLKGGIPCSNLELTKLSLIIELLKKRNCETALPCLYNRREFNVTLYKGDFCSDINAVAGNTVTISGNFIGYEGANFTTSCAPTPAYDYIDPEPVCDGCPAGYNESSVNTSPVCIESTSGPATTVPANPGTAVIVGGDNVYSYNKGGLNLLQDITSNLSNLPITFTSALEGESVFQDSAGNTIQGDLDAAPFGNFGNTYRLYSKINSSQFVQSNNPLFSTNTYWSPATMPNTNFNTAWGMLGYSGIWVNPNNALCTAANPSIQNCDNAGQYIEVYTCLNVPQSEGSQQYLLGVSADNAIKIQIKGPGFGDGETFIDFILLSAGTRDPFLWYHVFPITLTTGTYTLKIRGYDWGGNKAVSVDVFKMTVDYFKTNFCNTNLPMYSSYSSMQSILGSNAFPVGDVVNSTNLTTKRAELFNNTNCIFSLGADAFDYKLIGDTVYTEDVTYSCPLGADIDYCANATQPNCSTVTDTIPYYNCCDTGVCQDKFEGLSNKIIHVEYNPDLDVSTLHLENDFPTGPGNTCINYCISYTPTTETYLETFLNYIGKECSSCINKVELNNSYSNFDTVDTVPPVPQQEVTDSNGNPINLQNGIDTITL